MRHKPALSAWVAFIILVTTQHGYGEERLNNLRKIGTCTNRNCASFLLIMNGRGDVPNECRNCRHLIKLELAPHTPLGKPNIPVNQPEKTLLTPLPGDSKSSREPVSPEDALKRFLLRYSGSPACWALERICDLSPLYPAAKDNCHTIPIISLLEINSITKGSLPISLKILQDMQLVAISQEQYRNQPFKKKDIFVSSDLLEIFKKYQDEKEQRENEQRKKKEEKPRAQKEKKRHVNMQGQNKQPENERRLKQQPEQKKERRLQTRQRENVKTEQDEQQSIIERFEKKQPGLRRFEKVHFEKEKLEKNQLLKQKHIVERLENEQGEMARFEKKRLQKEPLEEQPNQENKEQPDQKEKQQRRATLPSGLIAKRKYPDEKENRIITRKRLSSKRTLLIVPAESVLKEVYSKLKMREKRVLLALCGAKEQGYFLTISALARELGIEEESVNQAKLILSNINFIFLAGDKSLNIRYFDKAGYQLSAPKITEELTNNDPELQHIIRPPKNRAELWNSLPAEKKGVILLLKELADDKRRLDEKTALEFKAREMTSKFGANVKNFGRDYMWLTDEQFLEDKGHNSYFLPIELRNLAAEYEAKIIANYESLSIDEKKTFKELVNGIKEEGQGGIATFKSLNGKIFNNSLFHEGLRTSGFRELGLVITPMRTTLTIPRCLLVHIKKNMD